MKSSGCIKFILKFVDPIVSSMLLYSEELIPCYPVATRGTDRMNIRDLANKIKFNKSALAIFEAPWLKKQVETHLFFGFCARKVPFAIFLLIAYGFAFLYKVIHFGGIGAWIDQVGYYFHKSPMDGLLSIYNNVIMILISALFLKLPKYHQAAIGWWIMNASLAVICFTILIAGGLVGFFRGSPDALYVTMFSLIWFPSIEFIKKLADKQQLITIGRILVTIPILLLWYRTGTWHWG